MNRFQQIGIGIIAALVGGVACGETVFVETESFTEHGGWVLDTAFTHIVGSPYLLAHGLGKPVADATTTVEIPKSGKYRVWVRTKDWVAPWNAPGAPGRFQVFMNDEALPTTFGTTGADWHWQDGGMVELTAPRCQLALHDLTGFDGRCDAILLSSDAEFTPPRGERLVAARRQWLNLPDGPEDMGQFDLVVVGGGYSGLGAAISAARQSLKVALVQDRFVLGGNGSSEVRVWANGGTMRGKYPHLGEIVEEFGDHAPDSPGPAEYFGDELKERICKNEKNLTLFLGHFARDVESDSTTGEIKAVIALDVRTGVERKFRGKLFVDCTGHGFVGVAAGAEYLMKPTGRMGMSNMFYWQTEDDPQSWPETPWALRLDVGDFPDQKKSRSSIDGKPVMKGEWFWESGFDKHPIKELELIRDWNLRAVFGSFSALKHGPEKSRYANAAMKWVAYVGGTRESRMLIGDVLLSRQDIVDKREFPDGCVATTWDIDLHYPKEQYAKKFPENPFISRAEFGAGVDRRQGYPVPYRCFYSKNVPNLFMAGRCSSVDHDALGTVRVMRTCGMMGEVVGKAAYLCVKHDVSPRGVYQQHLADLIGLIEQPGAMRRDSLGSDLYLDEEIAAVTPYYNKGADKMDGVAPDAATSIAIASLPGIVVDDTQAKLTGSWGQRGSLSPYVGQGYRYAAKEPKAEARFEFRIPEAGKYEVRMAWIGHENRASRASCTIERAGQPPIRLRIDQRKNAGNPQGFHSLGQFEFPTGEAAIVLSNEGADGHLHADAVQILDKR